MRDIGRLTGQSDVLRQLLDWIDGGDERTAVLEGPSGCGKTWLARHVADYRSNSTAIAIIAAGDRLNSGRSFIPFTNALESAARFSRTAQAAIPELTRSIPHIGQPASVIIQNILQYDVIKQSRQTPYLNQTERDILYELQRMAKGKHLVLILDDLHWWDESSLNLLILMMSGRVNSIFTFLQHAQYLAINTPEQTAIAPAKVEQVLSLMQNYVLRLDRCAEEHFGAVLLGLGLQKALQPDLAASLHKLCGGHLAIASLIVGHLNSQPSGNDLLHHTDFDDFCREIIGLRLAAIGSRSAELETLLKCAAVIGLSFHIDELTCLVKEAKELLYERIGEAKALSLITEHDGILKFTHEVFPRVLSVSDAGTREKHRQFAACLKRLRPGDYKARAQHLERAAAPFDARVMHTHAYLQDLRNGHRLFTLSSLDNHCTDTLTQFRETLRASMLAFDVAEYEEALAFARSVDESLPASLIAERDLVVARIHSSMLTPQDQARALELLSWDELWDEEFELWSRISHTRLVILAEIGKHEEAKSEARKLGARLRQRMDYDSDARRAFYRLGLKADTLYQPEAALVHLLGALEYFGPAGDSMTARDPMNYYICLCNLSANDYIRGDFESAYHRADTCNTYLRHAESSKERLSFPRQHILANNLILSAYRTNRMSLKEAGTLLERFTVSGLPSSGDSGLLASNRAAFLALEGKYDQALALLEPLLERFSAEATFDAYYVYFIGSNAAACHLACGNLEAARTCWASIASALPRLPEPVRQYLNVRHHLLSAAIQEKNATLEAWQRALDSAAKPTPLGPAWNHLGQVFLFSDLQFWTED